MPSISKAELDRLTETANEAEETAQQYRRDADHAEGKVRRFDAILDKIVRAADGRPLIENRNNYNTMAPFMGTSYGDPMRKLKTVERQEQEIARLNERIVGLEGRLAAVRAVATFAKEHKG